MKEVFELLEKELKTLVAERFKKPTPIQELVIPSILNGKNTLVISETGSGKTEACLLPIFDLWLKEKPRQISMLYITPLRSLNRDLLERIMWWSRHMDFDVSVRHGDTTPYERKMQAENPPDFLISTPETLQAILTGKLMREHLKNIRYIVIDEVHELVSNKRGVQLTLGLERLKELIKQSGQREPQMVSLSATIGNPERITDFLSMSKRHCKIIHAEKAKNIQIRVESPKTEQEDNEISSLLYVGKETAARLRRIRDLIKQKKSVLTFTNTREFAEVLSSRIKTLDKNLPLETHHSSLSKNVRIDSEKRFKEGEIKSLVCTSSLELGIDIGQIDLVIQYQSPRQVSKILQRVGRAGHSLEKTSEGLIISTDLDDAFESTVIASHAVRGEIEPTKPYPNALDILLHQSIGLAMDEYKMPFDKALGIIRRAYPYRNLTKEDFLEVCLLAQKLGFLWLSDKFTDPGRVILKRTKKAFRYYFENLSTIPDTKSYQIIDIISNKPVGTLDAEFISLHGGPGTAFICKGQAWRMLDIGRDKITVEPLKGIEAAIPAWEGELIPIPFDVAQGVGRIRSEIQGLLKSSNPNITQHLLRKYPITREVANKMLTLIKKQKEWGPVPDHENIIIEHEVIEGNTVVVINSCWGSLVNDTIGRALSAILMAKLGSVGLQIDPYRIILRIQSPDGTKEALDVLNSFKPGDIREILRFTMPNTDLFHWRFSHIAQRCGIISRDADYGKGYLNKIIEVYRDTPPFREALQEIEHEKLDIPKSEQVLSDLKSGKIKIAIRHGLSPIGRLGLSKRYEIIAPEKPEGEIFNIFKERLMSTRVGLICYQCGDWAVIKEVRDVPEKIVCKSCGAGMISVNPPRYILEAQELVRKRTRKAKLSSEDEKHLGMMSDSASLVLSSGRNAVKVLAGRGIGPKTAGRILSKQKREDELLKEILNAEKAYVKTRRFWRD